MDAATARVGSLSAPAPQPQRKEWRAVAEPPFQNNEGEKPENAKLGQSEERTIYEEVRGPLDVDVCSVTVDGDGLNGGVLQQRLHDVSVQRKGLEEMEVQLRAQVLARSDITNIRTNFDARIKEHAQAASKLKEQLHEMAQQIHDLDIKLEEKERELRAVKIDNEAVWAKADLLREQNKELATFRRERENSEAERVQHLQQIHELQDHIQRKANQFLELEEQHRVAHETILFKDEQLREAQAWMARAQEVDTFHSASNQALQTELRERTEQFNQYLISFQQQFAEMDSHHRQTIQKLQLELAEAREQSGRHASDSKMVQANLGNLPSYVQNKGNLFINDGHVPSDSSVFVSKGENKESFHSVLKSPLEAERVDEVAAVQPPINGVGGYLPSSQIIAPHLFVMHPQGSHQSEAQTGPHNPQSQMGYPDPVSPATSHQQWQNQQAVPGIHQIGNQEQHQPSHAEESNASEGGATYNYESSVVSKVVSSGYLGPHKSPGQGSKTESNRSNEKLEAFDVKEHKSDCDHFPSQSSQTTVSKNSDCKTVLGSDILENSAVEMNDGTTAAANLKSVRSLAAKQAMSAGNMAASAVSHSIDSAGSAVDASSIGNLPAPPVKIQAPLSTRRAPEPTLLDEKSLLACIVRAIPARSSSGIRISSTLPNRLGKMIAPLHWHDYKKQYGKLEDLVALHPELFVIDGDFICLREGAQGIISATTAVAKVAAAAAAASAPRPATLPSIAVTPVAQAHRIRRLPSAELKAAKAAGHMNGVSLDIAQGLSNVKIGNFGGLSSDGVGSGTDGTAESSQNRGSSDGRHGFGGGKQQGR